MFRVGLMFDVDQVILCDFITHGNLAFESHDIGMILDSGMMLWTDHKKRYGF